MVLVGLRGSQISSSGLVLRVRRWFSMTPRMIPDEARVVFLTLRAYAVGQRSMLFAAPIFFLSLAQVALDIVS